MTSVSLYWCIAIPTKLSANLSRNFFIPAQPRGHQPQPVPVFSSITTPLFTCLLTVVSLQVVDLFSDSFVLPFTFVIVIVFSAIPVFASAARGKLIVHCAPIVLTGELKTRCCSAFGIPLVVIV